jgi:calcineurin-like phosphoesterase family protein
MIWFTSDLHFGHAAVIDFCERPFQDLKDMEDKLVARINNHVKPEDTLIVVGDAFFTNSTERKRILDRINGTKVLVQGNHDKGKAQINGFDLTVQTMDLLIAGKRVSVSHYPFKPERFKLNMPWWKALLCDVENLVRFYHKRLKDEGQYLIHGHTHTRKRFEQRLLHVGCDAWNYCPVPITAIESYIAKRENKGEKPNDSKRIQD